jgi:hypothetical protein
MNYRFTFLILTGLVFLACESEKTGKMHHPAMVGATVDLLYLYSRHPQNTTLAEDSIQIILDNYNLTQKKYNRIIQDLNSKPERWEAFLQEVLDQINRFDDSKIDTIDPSHYLPNLRNPEK